MVHGKTKVENDKKTIANSGTVAETIDDAENNLIVDKNDNAFLYYNNVRSNAIVSSKCVSKTASGTHELENEKKRKCSQPD